ncbi:MAG: hypothetical protein A2Y62_18985 [Candidatus Fischerbacteria bacterium RBG_13_37_8]|uniref:4Fe-4S domain-containing protein n=1 Tax=Candidatus Fischerbacteria bacterium RBG_13_37_8 TaxID=1817863 RepID=A0A1F5VKZ2_9BACT|nr:MAG: hypothetical protein A2Y62_18985 [Candidatus Fischerbacteria bacterium RBG_13_37_8]
MTFEKEYLIKMKAIQIIGYKNSGKSTLILQLAERLKKRDYTVSILKNAHLLIMPEKDENMIQHAGKYMIASDKGAIFYIPSFLQFLQTLTFLHADYLIIEGFKTQNFMPRIICWKNESERKELASNLDIGNCGPEELKNVDKIDELIEAIEKRTFLLPGIDCGKCDFKTCHGMAEQIIIGNNNLMDCVTLHDNTKVFINGKEIALSPFVAHIMKQTFGGFLKSLKGVAPGNAVIEMQIES